MPRKSFKQIKFRSIISKCKSGKHVGSSEICVPYTGFCVEKITKMLNLKVKIVLSCKVTILKIESKKNYSISSFFTILFTIFEKIRMNKPV